MQSERRTQVDIKSLTFEMTKKLKVYLAKLVERKGSDLHIKSGSPVRGRIFGDIVEISSDIISKEDSLTLVKELLRSRFSELVERKSVDFTFKLNDNYNFRANIFFQMDGISCVFRTIPAKIPSVKSLRLPNVVHDFCSLNRGLVLVTGPTGSGKTTTLASMINEINHRRNKHIITIEDPIEFIFKDQKCIVNQRAIGQDALNFSDALRAALREDPDIILVGELRDMETIETAIHAAETGHLVLSTLHTMDAKETVNRLINIFPGNEQNRIKISLASVLQGVLSQRLIKRVDKGRVAAVEIMVVNARIESLILEGRENEIVDAIRDGKGTYKTQTFDQALFDLYKLGIISKKEAYLNATNRNDLKLQMDMHEDTKDSSQEFKIGIKKSVR
jgi:twitching motility protein PilT